MADQPAKSKGGGGRRAAPFFVRVAGELRDFRKLTVADMHAMTDDEWSAFRRESARRSMEHITNAGKTRAQNGLLEAQYYGEMRKYKAGTRKRPPEKPSAQRLPSQRQVYFLASLLGMEEGKRGGGFYDFRGIMQYVEFANRLPRGHGMHPRLQPNGKLLLNRQHWASAITLAKDGKNTHGSASRFMLEETGCSDELTPELISRGWVLSPRGTIRYDPPPQESRPSGPALHGDMHDGNKLPPEQAKRAKLTGSVDMGIVSMEELERTIAERYGH